MNAFERFLKGIEEDGLPEVNTEVTINSASLDEILIKVGLSLVVITAIIILLIKLLK